MVRYTEYPTAILKSFNRLLQNMPLDRSPCIIVGDLNINLLSQHEKYKDFLRMTESYGVCQLIKDPTRITNTSSFLIDHIYTNIFSHRIQSGYIVVGISDHFLKKKRITRRNFSLDSFLTDLRNKQWLDVYECSDADEAYNNFLSQFMIVWDIQAPSETTAAFITFPKSRNTFQYPLSKKYANAFLELLRLSSISQ